MGGTQSKAETEEKVFRNETPIHFSQDVVNQLSDRLASPETSPERQSTLDSHIRSRIQSELEHLRKEEENVRQEIEHALEKENLDRERTMAGNALDNNETTNGDVKSSAALMGDLEDIQRKVDRFRTRRDLNDFPSVRAGGDAVVSCYTAHPSTPLECWREVSRFKASVAQVEQACGGFDVSDIL